MKKEVTQSHELAYSIENWLDGILKVDMTDAAVAIVFNLYEDIGKNWSMEMVGASCFDEEDSDWACDEVTDFGTRENPFTWNEDTDWEHVLWEVSAVITRYLSEGKYAEKLKQYEGIGIGFVDGDLEILYTK